MPEQVRPPVALQSGQTLAGKLRRGESAAYAIAAAAGKSVVFRLESVKGSVQCARFTALGPGDKPLYDDDSPLCSEFRKVKVQAAGVALKDAVGSGYELRLPAAAAGEYALAVHQRGHADNPLPSGWDYRITATVE
jgi:hypothetical protein